MTDLSISQTAVFLIIATYFIGAIPFGLVFSSWLTGKDPRDFGSGNIGATNALRTGGKAVGILTLLADLLKGTLPVWLALELGFHQLEVALVALTAFLGHIFPVYLKFRGGKGVATMFGVLIPWLPWVALISFAIWLISYKMSRYVSLASILAGLVLPGLAWSFGASLEALVSCMILGGLMIIRHQTNIKRLIEGTETRP